MSDAYQQLIHRKSQLESDSGFEPVWMPEKLFPFQQALADWTVRKGRAAVFADCGLGKTFLELVQAENIARRTGGRVLILTPLAVAPQTIREADKLGVEAFHSKSGRLQGRIIVTNYERLHYFSPGDFEAVLCDESSVLKSFDGKRKAAITAFMRKVRYRGLYTATGAPNDYTELGTSSEALGYLGYMDMLARFFKNDRSNVATGRYHGKKSDFRLKHHAEEPFWRWICSWARSVRRPSDLGFENGAFTLPPITQEAHVVGTESVPEGMLFAVPAHTLKEQREERKRTLRERCEKVAELVSHNRPALVWCHLNAEGDRLEKIVPDSVQVSGQDSDDDKEAKLLDFASGNARVLVTKPKIGAWGLNFQHCSHVVFFPSHSFEQWYQGIRRCWRFGQSNPVKVDVVTTEGERYVLENLSRKMAAADRMFERIVAHMNRALHIEHAKRAPRSVSVPAWLTPLIRPEPGFVGSGPRPHENQPASALR